MKVINEAVKLAQERVDDLDLHMMEHVAFGKGVIKKLKIRFCLVSHLISLLPAYMSVYSLI